MANILRKHIPSAEINENRMFSGRVEVCEPMRDCTNLILRLNAVCKLPTAGQPLFKRVVLGNRK